MAPRSASRPPSGPTQRQLRVGELVRHALIDVLARGDLRDPDLDGVSVTVSEVRVSPDLKQATAFVMPLGGGAMQSVLDALARCRRYLRGEMGRRLDLKFTPDLSFKADESFGEASRIEDLLRSDRVRRDVDADSEGEED